MQSGSLHSQQGMKSDGGAQATPTLAERVLSWAVRIWRPAGSVVAVGLALLLTWHVINGKHGLSVWQQKRVEDRQLRKEIQDLEQENARLREHVQKLKSDPHAIEREAREKLHYAKPGEVIYSVPPDPPAPSDPATR